MKSTVKINEVLVIKEQTTDDIWSFFPVLVKLESGEKRHFRVSISDRDFQIVDFGEPVEREIPGEFESLFDNRELIDIFKSKMGNLFISNLKDCLDFIIQGNLRDFYYHFNFKPNPVRLVEIKPHWHFTHKLCYVFE